MLVVKQFRLFRPIHSSENENSDHVTSKSPLNSPLLVLRYNFSGFCCSPSVQQRSASVQEFFTQSAETFLEGARIKELFRELGAGAFLESERAELGWGGVEWGWVGWGGGKRRRKRVVGFGGAVKTKE